MSLINHLLDKVDILFNSTKKKHDVDLVPDVHQYTSDVPTDNREQQVIHSSHPLTPASTQHYNQPGRHKAGQGRGPSHAQ